MRSRQSLRCYAAEQSLRRVEQIPITDGLEVQANVNIPDLPPLLSLMVVEPWVQNFVFFPRGIPVVTDVAVVLALGAGRAGQ